MAKQSSRHTPCAVRPSYRSWFRNLLGERKSASRKPAKPFARLLRVESLEPRQLLSRSERDRSGCGRMDNVGGNPGPR